MGNATPRRIVIDPITRIEGHGRIVVELDDRDRVAAARFEVTQFRGFEKFCEGRPFYEMPSLTERICGICPVSHSLASAQACEAIMGVRLPATADRLRRLLDCASFIQSHTLSFFHLSAPDLLLGMDTPPEQRNLLGLLKAFPEAALDGIRLRQIGQRIIAALAGKAIHPSWVVPGGVRTGLSAEGRDTIRALLPEALEIAKRTLHRFKRSLEPLRDEIAAFANFPTHFMGLVDRDGGLDHLDGRLRIVDSRGAIVADGIAPQRYAEWIGEAVEPGSYLKSPYLKALGYPQGIYRVGPAARLNVCSGCGTPLADQEWAEFRELERGPVLSAFHNHRARLIEILHAIETMERLLADPQLLGPRFRARAEPNFDEGIGVVEAPRGTLIHHYRVDGDGLITWANLIVATGHNNLAIGRGVLQAAARFLEGPTLAEGAINRIQAVVRAFDPCLSCSTHALGQTALQVRLLRRGAGILAEYPPAHGAEDPGGGTGPCAT
jgi:NAD-reducing hydrogenase large subunit